MTHMKIRRLACAASGAALFLAGCAPVLDSSSAQVRPHEEFTIRYEERVARTGEQPRLSAQRWFARRADGSTVQKIVGFNDRGQAFETTRRILLPNGIVAEVYDTLQVAKAYRPTTFDYSRKELQTQTAEDCPAPSGIGEKFWGFETVQTREDRESFRLTAWRSQMLHCAELKRHVAFKSATGQVTDTSEMTPVSVEVGAPDSTLFAVADSYQRLAPSQIYKLDVERAGAKVEPDALAHLLKVDEQYRSVAYSGPIR